MKIQRASQTRTTETSRRRGPATSIEALAPVSPSVHPMVRLRQTIGNRAVQRRLRSRAIQAKLKISQTGDSYEQKGDRVAGQVMRMPEPVIQRACSACAAGGSTCSQCETEKQPLLQRKTEQHSDSSERGGMESVQRKEEAPAKSSCGSTSLAGTVGP